MAEFWKSIESAVTAALIGLIPLIAAAVGAWLRAKAKKWQTAQDSVLEAAELGAKVGSEIPDQLLEDWAVNAMKRRTQQSARLGEGEARQLVRKVRDKLRESSGNNGSPSPLPPLSPLPPKNDPPTE